MDELREGLTIAGRGMGVVFLALILLLLLMLGLKRLLAERPLGPPKAAPAGSSTVEETAARGPVHLSASVPSEAEGAVASVSVLPATPPPSPEDDELEQVAVLAAAMAMAMETDLETWPALLPLPARASAVWRVQGRLHLMEGQGRPRFGWRR